MTILKLVSTILIFSTMPILAFPTSFQLKKRTDNSRTISQFSQGKIRALGKSWPAKDFCNDQTVANPEQLESYQLQINEKTKLVVLCPGSLDGEENVVTIFSMQSKPVTKKVKPPTSSNRITDQQLNEVVSKLIK